MRLPWAMVLLWACGVACQHGSDAPVDASPPPPPPQGPPECILPGALCGGATCGNGQLDTCWIDLGPSHFCWPSMVMEKCDGANVPSCASLGFFGGSTKCVGCMSTDTSTCDACAPGVVACLTYPLPELRTPFVVSGSRVAVGGWANGVTDVTILEAATELTRTQVTDIADVAPTPSGWLAALWSSSTEPMTLTPLAFDGTLGTSQPLPINVQPYHLFAGVPNRVLLTWLEDDANNASQLHAAIADATGVLVAGPSVVFATDSQYDAASDGASFFVGGNGRLARIAPDGAATIATGFPAGWSTDDVTVIWGDGGGWYLLTSSTGVTAQRFDAAGAKLGAPFAIAAAEAYIADGDGLLALRRSAGMAARIELVRIDATGAVIGVPKPVGAGGQVFALERLGANVFVAWRQTSLYVAIVVP